jgi:hypothetical protein
MRIWLEELEQDETAIPETLTDLPAAASTNETTSHPERVLAVLEMVRHNSISLDRGAALAGISRETLVHLLNKLQIPFEQ